MGWRDGLVCPSCGNRGFCALRTRKVFQCNRCKKQLRLTAGTVFENTKLPLTSWFLAIYHLTQSKGGISSIEIGRRLGVKQSAAWLKKHKLMRAMAGREAHKPKLEGRIEIDATYLGGERSGGKRGRGAAGKTRRSLPPWRPPPSGSRAGLSLRWSRASARRRSRRSPSATSCRAATLLATACPAGWPSSRPAARISRCGPARAGRPHGGRPSPGSTPCWATSRPPWSAPTITSAPSTPHPTSPASPTGSTAATSSTASSSVSPGLPCALHPSPIASSVRMPEKDNQVSLYSVPRVSSSWVAHRGGPSFCACLAEALLVDPQLVG